MSRIWKDCIAEYCGDFIGSAIVGSLKKIDGTYCTVVAYNAGDDACELAVVGGMPYTMRRDWPGRLLVATEACVVDTRARHRSPVLAPARQQALIPSADRTVPQDQNTPDVGITAMDGYIIGPTFMFSYVMYRASQKSIPPAK